MINNFDAPLCCNPHIAVERIFCMAPYSPILVTVATVLRYLPLEQSTYVYIAKD
jgi:hypothetical protein